MTDFRFEYVLQRDDDEFALDVVYEGSVHRASRWEEHDYFATIVSVTLDDIEFELTEKEEAAILDACYDRLENDLEAEADGYGDYVYEMRRYDD